jgi:DNA-binding Lrp family transcriptional regulator
MKKIEWKLISELMKNSKNSDRELAKKIGVSQPTITRARSRLEKEGYIKEYTMIPDFSKLGFELMSINLAKMKKEPTEEEYIKIKKMGSEVLKKHPFAIVMAMSGRGCGYDKVIIAFHENYTSFLEFMEESRKFPFSEVYDYENFLVGTSGYHYMPLTFSALANYLSTSRVKEEVPLHLSDNIS